MTESAWISTGTAEFRSQELPELNFPVKSLPDIYAPQSTTLILGDGTQSLCWLWCYMQRKTKGSRYLFNPASLSARRIEDLPRAIERLGKMFCFKKAKPRTVASQLSRLAAFLNWADDPLHHGRYEAVLSDSDLALAALKGHHTYLRQRVQANTEGRIGEHGAGQSDSIVMRLMGEIHDRNYTNEIEPIRMRLGSGVKAPKSLDVGAFMASMEGVFDSVVRISSQAPQTAIAELRWQSAGQEAVVPLQHDLPLERVLELGCLAFAALCIGDSGSNLAQIQGYEEPDDLDEQLSNPERLSLKRKVIKLRARGALVPVHFSATTVTRMRGFLALREALRSRVSPDADISQMFIQCEYGHGPTAVTPLAIKPLSKDFTGDLKRRFKSFGVQLPKLTLQQLRAFKHGEVAKSHGPAVAAKMMGQTVATAIRSYCKTSDEAARAEMAPFLAQLTAAVIQRTSDSTVIPITPIPPGGCKDHGNPAALVEEPLVNPDCSKTEGCFFCDKLAIHADEDDATKLMSCRSVLLRLPAGDSDTSKATRVFTVVIARIEALLAEIQRLAHDRYERARTAVEAGNLHPFWARKLQQLHLLGMLRPQG